MAAIAYRRRALPVCWQVRRRTGVSDADQQKSLLAKLSKRIEEACEARSEAEAPEAEAPEAEAPEAEVPEVEAPEVIVIGDGSFHSTELMSYLSDKDWFYRLRLHSDSYVRLSKEGSWQQLGDLAPEEGGEYRYLNGVYVTKTDPYGPVSIAICHADGEEDPWFIATSEQQEADYLTLRTYSRRMWIEELFGDLQAGGFQLQKSGLYEPARLSRLVMALSWTYVWLMNVGVWATKRGFRKLVGRTDRRDRSYAEIGRRYIQRCMTNGKPLHVSIKPYFRKLSGS